MSRIYVGVIGLGDISGTYLKNLQNYSEVLTVTACACRSLEKARMVAQRYGIAHAYRSAEELISDREIDAVLNLTPPDVHAKYSKMALSAGKHVYSEKPLAMSTAEGRVLLELAADWGLLIGCAPDTFLGARLQTVMELMREGVIGPVHGVQAAFATHGPEWFHPNPDFLYQPGAGPLFDMAPYYLTALTAALGPVKRVYAAGHAVYPQRTVETGPRRGGHIPVEKSVPAHVCATIEFLCGAVGNLLFSFDVWASTAPHMEFYGSQGTICVEEADPLGGPNLFGGNVYLKLRESYHWDQKAPLEQWQAVKRPYSFDETDHRTNSRVIGLVDLAYAIRERRQPRASGDMALHVLEVIEGILTSIRENRCVEMNTVFAKPEPLPMGIGNAFPGGHT